MNTLCKSADNSRPIRILIADDHAVVLEGLGALLGRQDDMLVVAEASNGIEAVELWKRYRPDVTLLDLQMPKLDGIGAIQQIHNYAPTARIIVLTTYDTDEQIYGALKAGAKAYLLKEVRRKELLETIRHVHAGETSVSSELITRLVENVNNASLTHRELEVLALVGEGKSNREIGVSLNINETTVKSHMKHIFSKLGVSNRTEAMKIAIQRGLIQF